MEKKTYAIVTNGSIPIDYVTGYMIDSQLRYFGEAVQIGVHKGERGWIITDLNTGFAMNHIPYRTRKDAVSGYYLQYRLPLKKLIEAAENDWDAYYNRKKTELDELIGVRS